MPQISIAMTTYNGAKYLREQLDSIAAQSRTPDELVVCDDRSSDDTPAVLEAFAARAPFPVRFVVNEERLGYARNFEKAIGLCSGDLIFPCDQDDVWDAAKLRAHEAIYLDQPDVTLILNDARLVDEGLKPLGRTWFQAAFHGRELEAVETDRAFAVLLRETRICGCMLSFRARFWDRVKPIPDRIGHDDWLALTLSLLGRVRVLTEPLNDYRQHVSQVTRANTPAPDAAPARPTAPDRAARLARRAGDLENMLARFKDFQRPGEVLRFPGFYSHLAGLLGHKRRRAAMSGRLIRRLPAVAAEFALGNYGRYNESVKDSLSYDLKPTYFR